MANIKEAKVETVHSVVMADVSTDPRKLRKKINKQKKFDQLRYERKLWRDKQREMIATHQGHFDKQFNNPYKIETENEDGNEEVKDVDIDDEKVL